MKYCLQHTNLTEASVLNSANDIGSTGMSLDSKKGDMKSDKELDELNIESEIVDAVGYRKKENIKHSYENCCSHVWGFSFKIKDLTNFQPKAKDYWSLKTKV